MRGNIRIVATPSPHPSGPPADVRVYIDGHEIQGLVNVSFRLASDAYPSVILEVEPSAIEYDGPADLVITPAQWDEP